LKTGKLVRCYHAPGFASSNTPRESQATIEAMVFDGVKRETVKTFVLDKKMKL
jgi:hypothetical protein